MKKTECILAVLFNIGILVYYKYFDFIIVNINSVFDTSYALKNLLLPLGISFFTFQQISYIIDTYKGETKQYNFIQYACFVSYFPQLIAGPIVTHDELIPQFENESTKKFNWDNFSCGIYMFALGMAKKVLIADTFAKTADWGFSKIGLLDTTNALIVIFAYTIQIYFDFSGYCDMAIGISKMMNIDLPVNFDSPYKALTITEFWSRWHKTLTRFFTKYIYIPLGGNRKGKFRTYINVLIVFLVSGLWHGASWNFVFWGVLHGIFMVLTRAFKKVFEKIHPVLNWLITFSFVNMAWVFFRVSSIRDGFWMIKQVFKMNFGAIDTEIVKVLGLRDITKFIRKILTFNVEITYPYLGVLIILVGVLVIILKFKNAKEYMFEFKPTVIRLFVTVFLIVWSVVSFASVSPFLYYNF